MAPSQPSLPWRHALARLGLFDRRSCLEVLLACVLALAALGIWWQRGEMALPKQVALWLLLLLAVGILLRRGWLRLFGPVLFHDLVRMARKHRLFFLRTLYGVALLIVLSWANFQFWQGKFAVTAGMPTRFQRPPTALDAHDLAELAEGFFKTFCIVQFLTILVLTPAYTAGAIAEEKDRKTMEFLLATDLNGREIVLGKLISRLATLGLIVLTGMPVLSLTQFLGGVDPNLVLAGFALSGLALMSLASFSILNSVYFQKPRDAITITYLGVAIYVGVTTLAARSLRPSLLATLLESGNILAAYHQLEEAVSTGKDLADVTPGVVLAFALFHCSLALVCTIASVLLLRPIALANRPNRRRRPIHAVAWWWRPRIGRLPMIWKEVFIEPSLRLNWVGWMGVVAGILISLAPGVWILGAYLVETLATARGNPLWTLLQGSKSLTESMNGWVRISGAIVGSLMLLGVAARASGSVSGERDRETLDALLTSPLESHHILFPKLLGSFLAVRWAWVWLGLIWGLGVLTGGLHPLAVPLMLVAWCIYAGALGCLGLWYSTTCPSTLHANLKTLTAAGILGAFHWCLWMFCCPSLSASSFGFHSTLTPPFMLYWLSFSSIEMEQGFDWDLQFYLALFGLIVWILYAGIMWRVTRTRFRRISARMPYHTPDIYQMPRHELEKYLRARRQQRTIFEGGNTW